MLKMLRRNYVFIALSAIFLIGLGIVLLHYDKASLHLWMNSYHTPALDFIFRYYTYVGEWVPYVIVVILLFYKAGWASFLLADVAVSGLIAQRLKYVFDTDRPYRWFAEHMPNVQLPFVDGVTLSKCYSFPSGHTVTFFAMFMVISIILTEVLEVRDKNKEPRTKIIFSVVNLVCFLLAVLGAYSRIYLNQHFAEDIFGGAVWGLVCTLLLYLAVPCLEKTSFWNWNFKKMQKK